MNRLSSNTDKVGMRFLVGPVTTAFLGSVHFAIFVLGGTVFLFSDIGNLWLRASVAVLSYGSGLRSLTTGWGSRHGLRPDVAFRIWAIASTVAGGLGCIGSFLLGGVVGWLGVFVSLRVALTGAWVLRKMTTWRVAETVSR
jgi:hypothetical protein